LAQTATAERWSARPLEAACVRAFAFLAPIALSIAFVHIVSRVVPAPTSSWWLFLLWWGLLSGLATGVLVGADRLSRRLLPLAALLKLSLVFPDRAPSRFRTALRAGTVETLEQRIDKASAARRDGGPTEAAERLLELVAALDAHDKLTRGHAERVRAYSQMIADEIRLGKEDRDLLNWAALLHDIGKLGVPSEILTKRGRLSEEEFAAIKRHPELGAELVAPLRSWLGEWVEAVRDHHERWDGKGYPHGRAGDEITLGGRVVAVADVFDVITSARSYKDASSTIEARKELARNAGSQFDERIVRAFLGVSLGRLRFAMGPLAWLAHLPVLGRVPLTPAVSSLSGALAVVAAAATTGLVVEPDPGRAAEAGRPALERSAAAQPAPAASPRRPARRTRTARPAPTDLPTPTPSFARPGGRPASPAGRAASPVADETPSSPAPTRDSVEPTGDRLEPPAHPAAVRLAPSVASFVDEDSTVVIDLFGITASEDVATLRISAPPHVGHSLATPEHAISYRPPPNYHGKTTIGYEVCWRDDHCALGLARITVRPVNDAPRATDDVIETDEDEPVSIDVLTNDSDVDDEPLHVSSVTGETHGNAVIRDGEILWSGPPNFHGRASFVYGVEDPDGASGTGRVTVAVSAVNDVPRAASDSASTEEDVPVRIRVLANDSDLDGDVLKVRDLATPGTGSVSHDGTAVTYSPPPDFSGSTTFTYGASDGKGGNATGTVEVSVAPVNDAPRALDDAASVLENESISINVLGNDGDPEGDAISLASFSQPSLGSAVRDGDRVLFTAPATAGSTSFEYVVGDVQGATGRGVVSITIVGINSPPSFTGGPDQAVPEDAGIQSVAGWAQAITAGPADESAQAVTFLATNTNNALFSPGGQPAVSADGTLTYETAANATGSAGVTIRARDDGGTANGGSDTSAPYTFTIAVSNVNDPPTAAADAASVDEDASAGVTFSVLANDTDPDPGDLLSVASYDASGVTEGTLTHIGAGMFTFVPDPSFNGSQSFSYTVGDGNGGADTAAATIVVTPQPDVPVASDDAYATSVNTAVVRAAPGVLANDADEDEDALAVQTTPVSAPANGSLTLSADGSFAYTPNLGFIGTDTFTYRVSDGTGLTDDAAVTITVSLTSAASLLYLGTTGPSADIYDLTTAPPAPATPVPDFDGDGEPGLTIKNSNGDESETDPRKWHTWARPVSLAPLVLNGPVTLQLWSSVDGFDPDDDVHPHVFLYDCLIGGLACVRIAQTDVYVPSWNGGSSTWVYREVTIGSVDRTIILGRELRVRLQTSQNDLWVAMTAALPSALEVTTP
jgi:putative nucleotidyltransferase with HDIG domain